MGVISQMTRIVSEEGYITDFKSLSLMENLNIFFFFISAQEAMLSSFCCL